MPREDAAKRFAEDTKTHQAKIIHDQGLYRSITCRRADGSSCYYFCVTTWPGYIAITGDMGDYTFSRIPDMFEYCRRQSGVPDLYQLESKCDAVPKTSRLHNYAHEELVAYVNETREEHPDKDDGDWDDLLANLCAADEHYNKHLMYTFSVNGDSPLSDPHDWPDFTELSFHFEWCCYAIVWAINQYDTLTAATAKQPVAAGDKARVAIDVDVTGIGEDGTACVTYPWGEHRMMAHFMIAQLQKLDVTKTPSLAPDPSESIPTA